MTPAPLYFHWNLANGIPPVSGYSDSLPMEHGDEIEIDRLILSKNINKRKERRGGGRRRDTDILLPMEIEGWGCLEVFS